jgi:2-methylisoborneol synthase
MDPVPKTGDLTPPPRDALRTIRSCGCSTRPSRTCAGTPPPGPGPAGLVLDLRHVREPDGLAAWRETGEHPPAWEYLAARHHDSFYTSMTLIDVAGGYEVPAGLFYEPRVRPAAMRAGTASVIVNDLHSGPGAGGVVRRLTFGPAGTSTWYGADRLRGGFPRQRRLRLSAGSATEGDGQ